jgi:hypothetical protein
MYLLFYIYLIIFKNLVEKFILIENEYIKNNPISSMHTINQTSNLKDPSN